MRRSLAEPAPLSLQARRGKVRVGGIHVHGACGAGSQQVDLDCPDPAADVEQRRILDAFRLEGSDQVPGVAVRASAPVRRELAARHPFVEEGVVVGPATAGGHGG